MRKTSGAASSNLSCTYDCDENKKFSYVISFQWILAEKYFGQRRVAGQGEEREIEDSVFDGGGFFFAVQVAIRRSVAGEEEHRAHGYAPGLHGLFVLPESAERSHSGAGTDHDDRTISLDGKVKIGSAAEEAKDPIAGHQPGEKIGAKAVVSRTLSAFRPERDDGRCDVDPARIVERRRRDAVEARL